MIVGSSGEIQTSSDAITWTSQTTSIGFKYWRLTVDDPANPDTYIQIADVFLGLGLTMPGMELGQKLGKRSNAVAKKSDSGQLFGLKKIRPTMAEFNFMEVTDANKVLVETFIDYVDLTECFYLLVWENSLDVQPPVYVSLVEIPEIERSTNYGLLWNFSMKCEECF